MYKIQVYLFEGGYVINDNENEAENEKKIAQIQNNRPRSRNGHKYTKYQMCQSITMTMCIKQQLSNI